MISLAIEVGNAVWNGQKQRFLAACASRDSVAGGSARKQDRTAEDHLPITVNTPIKNAPDTNLALPVKAE